jgi:hypothetical protein
MRSPRAPQRLGHRLTRRHFAIEVFHELRRGLIVDTFHSVTRGSRAWRRRLARRWRAYE